MNKNVLLTATKDYWQKLGSEYKKDIFGALEEYIGVKLPNLGNRSLLEAELAWAKEQNRLPPDERSAETLVLLVGFSIEPLLQSVCVYKPASILLVLNESYAGEDGLVIGSRVRHAIEQLTEFRLLEKTPLIVSLNLKKDRQAGKPGDEDEEAADSPASVFRALVAALHETTDVIIDITGGKKSMVSGAFLYASYANATISYVDFEDYDGKERRPYGYECKIRAIVNPYQKFSLRDWERVRTLYRTYRFQEAGALLKNSIEDMFTLSLPDAAAALTAMQAVIACYAGWENGDYHLAHQQVGDIQASIGSFAPPPAVTILGPDWFHKDDAGEWQNVPKFYGDSRLPVYLTDELARIRRIIDYSRDYRAAFLRAGGLNEVIMVARLVRLASTPEERDSLLVPLDKDTPHAKPLFRTLAYKKVGETINVPNKVGFTNAPNLILTVNKSMEHWWVSKGLFCAENGWEDFIEYRNDLTHKYAPAPKEWADAAYCFVKANIDDFLRELNGPQQQPTGSSTGSSTAQDSARDAGAQEGKQNPQKAQQTITLAWEQLCNDTGMTKWLPAGLVKGEG